MKNIDNTPLKIAKKFGLNIQNLVNDVDCLSEVSLLNLKRRNPKKYEITMIGLIAKELNIGINDLLYMHQVKKEISQNEHKKTN